MPQRRKRIFLVADLNARGIAKVLFESEGVSAYSAERFRTWQRTAAAAENRSRAAGGAACIFENHAQDSRITGPLDVAPTVSALYGTGGNNQPLVLNCYDVRFTSEGTRNVRANVYETDASRTIDCGGNSPDRNQGGLAVVSYGIDRAAFNQGENARYGFAVERETEPTIVARGPSAAAVPTYSSSHASFFTCVSEELANTLTATDYKNMPIVNDFDVDYIVRRLTPTECARLQGFPDWWCGVHIHIGADGHTAQTLRNLANIMASHERLLASALKLDNRRMAQYCRVVDERFLNELNRKKPHTMADLADIWYGSQNANYGRNEHYNGSRYHMLNLHATFTKGTVEFRLFQFDAPSDGKQNGLHAGQLKSYIQLCLALSALAKNAKSASPKPQQTENPKYAMRTWLNKQYEQNCRDPETAKRYGTAWKIIRKRYIAAHPLCEECLRCGFAVPAEHVHHIIPLADGGTNDESNLMSLCKSCHSRIHMKMKKPRWEAKVSPYTLKMFDPGGGAGGSIMLNPNQILIQTTDGCSVNLTKDVCYIWFGGALYNLHSDGRINITANNSNFFQINILNREINLNGMVIRADPSGAGTLYFNNRRVLTE